MNESETSGASLRACLLAAFAVGGLFLWEGTDGFSLWDEGFLWYGAQRVMLGEVPIRDFMAYDPGRYYWAAGLMNLWGDSGIMSLRLAVAIFQALGLLAGLLLVSRCEKRGGIRYLLLAALTLAVWMYPRHKLFDVSLSILLVYILAFWLERPTTGRYFLAGLGVGIVAVFGRNHGLYGAAGSVAVMGWLSIKRTDEPGFIKGFLVWTAGVAIGYTPILFMCLAVPSFAGAFRDSVLFLFERGSTNLPLPVPWPWRASFDSLSFAGSIRGVLIGLFFIAVVVFGVVSILWLIRQRIRARPISPVFAAASFLSLPYAHYAYSRADVPHLAQGIFPLLIGCLAVLAAQPARVKWPLASILCAASLTAMLAVHPGWECQVDKSCVNLAVSSNRLRVDPATASDVTLLTNLADRYAGDGRSFIAAPFWPGAYALLRRKSPMWDIYALFPRSPAFEQAEIQRIEAANPGFALVLDLPLDGHDELRFSNTHPLINQYIVDHFERLPDSYGAAYHIYRKKEGMP